MVSSMVIVNSIIIMMTLLRCSGDKIDQHVLIPISPQNAAIVLLCETSNCITCPPEWSNNITNRTGVVWPMGYFDPHDLTTTRPPWIINTQHTAMTTNVPVVEWRVRRDHRQRLQEHIAVVTGGAVFIQSIMCAYNHHRKLDKRVVTAFVAKSDKIPLSTRGSYTDIHVTVEDAIDPETNMIQLDVTTVAVRSGDPRNCVTRIEPSQTPQCNIERVTPVVVNPTSIMSGVCITRWNLTLSAQCGVTDLDIGMSMHAKDVVFGVHVIRSSLISILGREQQPQPPSHIAVWVDNQGNIKPSKTINDIPLPIRSNDDIRSVTVTDTNVICVGPLAHDDDVTLTRCATPMCMATDVLPVVRNAMITNLFRLTARAHYRPLHDGSQAVCFAASPKLQGTIQLTPDHSSQQRIATRVNTKTHLHYSFIPPKSHRDAECVRREPIAPLYLRVVCAPTEVYSPIHGECETTHDSVMQTLSLSLGLIIALTVGIVVLLVSSKPSRSQIHIP